MSFYVFMYFLRIVMSNVLLLLIFKFRFLCCVFCFLCLFVCLCPVSCVPNVASFPGLSILDCLSGYLIPTLSRRNSLQLHYEDGVFTCMIYVVLFGLKKK